MDQSVAVTRKSEYSSEEDRSAILRGGERSDSPKRLSLDQAARTRRTSLSLPEKLTIESWQRIGKQIFLISNSSAWWLGDWLIFGEERYPDRYIQALNETPLDYQTLRNYAWVARAFPASRRRDRLSFQHHAEVAGLPHLEQDKWLDRAEQLNWSRNALRGQLQASRRKELPCRESVIVRVTLDPTREQSWQAAAEKSGCNLIDWMMRSLDRAAETATAVDAKESSQARPISGAG